MMPAPPIANLPRCTRCQSVGPPSADEYWHMGDTTTRLRAVSARSSIGVKRSGVAPGDRAFTVDLPVAGCRIFPPPEQTRSFEFDSPFAYELAPFCRFLLLVTREILRRSTDRLDALARKLRP